MLIYRLKQSERFQGVTIDVVRLSFAGFKEPQQLMTLNYVLALGGQLDGLVNIDGFNEVALPTCENQDDIFAAYPRLWNTLTINLVDPRHSAEAYRLLELRALGRKRPATGPIRPSAGRRRGTCSGKFATATWRKSSPLASVVFTKEREQGRAFATAGPPQLYHSEKERYPQLAELWANGSRQLNYLCRANRIAYVHVLQPNQYVPNSKSIGPLEMSVAYRDDNCYASGVKDGYPELLCREKLRADGVDFHDLTRLFAAFADPIYVDTCCHYNQKGNDLLAEAVAEALLANLDHASH